MSFKTFLQILVICLIFTIIGSVYLLYFKESKDLIQKQKADLVEEKSTDLENFDPVVSLSDIAKGIGFVTAPMLLSIFFVAKFRQLRQVKRPAQGTTKGAFQIQYYL